LAAFFAVSTVRSGTRIWAQIAGDYATTWMNAKPVGFATDALLVIGAFYGVSRFFPRFYPWALRLVAALAFVSIAALALAALEGGPAAGPERAALWIYHNSEAYWLAFLCLSGLWFWQFIGPGRIAVSRNALNHLGITIIYLTVNLTAHTIGSISQRGSLADFVGQVWLQVGCTASFAAWAALMTSLGERAEAAASARSQWPLAVMEPEEKREDHPATGRDHR
jgi:hypothetical protein